MQKQINALILGLVLLSFVSGEARATFQLPEGASTLRPAFGQIVDSSPRQPCDPGTGCDQTTTAKVEFNLECGAKLGPVSYYSAMQPDGSFNIYLAAFQILPEQPKMCERVPSATATVIVEYGFVPKEKMFLFNVAIPAVLDQASR